MGFFFFFLKVNIFGICLFCFKNILLAWYFKLEHWLQYDCPKIFCAGRESAEVGIWLWFQLFHRQTHPECVANSQLAVPAITIQITNKHGRKSIRRDSLTLSDSSKTHYFDNEHSPSMTCTRLNFYANRFISFGTTLALKIKLTISIMRHNTIAAERKEVLPPLRAEKVRNIVYGWQCPSINKNNTIATVAIV